MVIRGCEGMVDQNGKELAAHGTVAFPVGCYEDDLLETFVPWHWHEEWEAVVVAEGRTVVSIGTERLEISRGDGFFINSNVLHSCRIADQEGCCYHTLVFHPRLVGGSTESVYWRKYVDPLLQTSGLTCILLRRGNPWMEEALGQIEKAWQACAEEYEGYEFTVRSALSELVFLLQGHCGQTVSLQGKRSDMEAERMKQMLEFIHENYAQPITVKEIAEQAIVSESTCLRSFKTTLGISPVQYLKDYRLQKTAVYLENSDRSVSEIALSCGFSDMSYYAKSFRRLMGCTPTEFRSRNGKEKVS